MPTFRFEKGWFAMDAETVVRPVVEGAGLELVDVSFGGAGGRRVLRVVVDRPEGLDLGAIAELSEKIARRLDLEDFGDGRYELEVSSPGIERPLRTTDQFRRFVGSRVKVKTEEPVEGARVHDGILIAADRDELRLSIDGTERRIPMRDVGSARTVADWDAELKGTTV